jgi:4-hydroxybenzoate polyprenyltransferase
MEAAQSEEPRAPRNAARLVFGVDNTIASTVYGTITAMATVAAFGRAYPDRPWKLVLLVAATAVVFWVAHLYAHGLSESISERQPLRPDMLRTLAHRELGIVLAAVPPTVALALGALGIFGERTAIWLALAAGLATLAVEGARYARLEHLGPTGTVVAVATNVGLGLFVVALKVGLLH